MPRHQHSAVDRNRLKRRLRELVRVDLLRALRAAGGTGAPPAADVSIRARREAYGASIDALRRDVLVVAKRLSVIDPAPGSAAPSASSAAAPSHTLPETRR